MSLTIQIGSHSVLISECDAESVLKRRWHIFTAGRKGSPRFIPATTIEGKRVRMHRFLINPPAGTVVDHINSDTLDNRRENLRACKQGENTLNQRKRSAKCSSQFKGVYRTPFGKWETSIQVKGERLRVGYFENEVASALCYDISALHFFGQFARPNFNIVEAALAHPAALQQAIERCQQKGIIAPQNQIAA